MLVIRLPKWSIVMMTPETWSGVTVGSSTHDGTISVVFGPSSAGATRPAASSAAIGAKMSRPWKVALGTGSLNRAIAFGVSSRKIEGELLRDNDRRQQSRCPARETHALPRLRR